MSVTKSNAIRDELVDLRDNLCLKWRDIAKMPKFKGIPIQTLSMIYLGKRDVPKKFRKQLGEPATAPAPVCLVHGVVHCFDCRTQTVRKQPKPRPPRQQIGWLMSFYETKEWDKVVKG